ncbi:MAG TPA: hypothetical protein VGN57_01545 [Pirellulaceae bacterium]|jgi:hypothetical protein|nr:hypothetical protein [Pirellulaceae bacterium]
MSLLTPSPVVDTAFLQKVEALASLQKMYVEIEDVAPVHVPAGYEITKHKHLTSTAIRLFDNGSTVTLNLLPF